MGNAVPKQELIRSVYYSQDLGNPERIQKFLIEDIFDIFIENIATALVDGERVYLRGFGTFNPIRENLSRGNVYCPVTEKIVETYILKHGSVFRPSKALIRKVNIGIKDVFERYFNYSDNP